MSGTSPFDTLKFSTQLREGGFTQQQADTLTSSLQEALSATVATKADLDEVKSEVKADIVGLREDMAKGFQDVHKSFQDVHKGFQDVYKFMLVSTLTIAGTIIGTAIALVGSGSVCLFPLTPALSLQGRGSEHSLPLEGRAREGGGATPAEGKSDVKLNHYALVRYLAP